MADRSPGQRPRVPSQNTERREMRQRAMTIVMNAGVNDGAGGGIGGVGADDAEEEALSDPMARRLAEFNRLAGKASLHHVKDGQARLHQSTTPGSEQSPRLIPVRRKSVPTVNFGGEQGLVKITCPAPEVRLSTQQQNHRTPTLVSTAAVPEPKPEPESAPDSPGQRPRVPSHNTVRRELRQRAMTIVMNAGVDDGTGGGIGGGKGGGGGAGGAEEEALSDPMARRLAEFSSLAGKAVRRKSVPTVNFDREQGLVQRTPLAPEVREATHQQSRRTPALESRAAVPEHEPKHEPEHEPEPEHKPEPEPELESEPKQIGYKMVARTTMQATQIETAGHTDTGHREAEQQPYAMHKATATPNGRAASAVAISAELAQLEAMEKDRLQQNLSFLQDTERSRADEENRIIEKSHTWRERQSRAETRYNKAVARVAAKAEQVTSLPTKSTDLDQPSSPRGSMVADDPRYAGETEVLAASLAAEQRRVTALENEVAEMRTAWEEERVMAAAERAALEQALAAQSLPPSSGELANVTRADGGDGGSRHLPSAVGGPLQVDVDGINAMAQPQMPVPPHSPAKRPHAHAGRSRKVGATRPQTAFGRRQYQQPSATGSRPSSARVTRPPCRPSKREMSSARQRPHRPDDVIRSDTARAMLEEWIRADKTIHADRRELRTNLPADNGRTIGSCEDDEARCNQASAAQRCARRRSYRRLCVKLVEALNADALGAVHRCERERAIKLLLEARRVLANDCFGKTPSAEMQEQSHHLGEVGSKDSKAVSYRLDDGRNLHEWVRLHSCTLNNLAIAHRERARANKTSSLDPKSARALAKVNADAKAMLKAPGSENCELQPSPRSNDQSMKLALRFLDRARALEHGALVALGQTINTVDTIMPAVPRKQLNRTGKSRQQILKHKAATSVTPRAMDSANGAKDLGEEPRPDPTILSTSDAVSLIRGNVPISKSKIIGSEDYEELGRGFAKTLLNVYGIHPVLTVPLQHHANYDRRPDITTGNSGAKTGRNSVAATVALPVHANAYGHCFPGSAYAQRVSGRHASKTNLGKSARKQQVGWEATVPLDYRPEHFSSTRQKPRISQTNDGKEAPAEGQGVSVAEPETESRWRLETADERHARLIRKESVATTINCAALLSALSQHHAAMQRLEEAWTMLVFSEEAVPLPRNHRRQIAPREQLKQCIASSVAAEWAHLGRDISVAAARRELEGRRPP